MKNLSQKLLEDVTANTKGYPFDDAGVALGTRTANGGDPADLNFPQADHFELPKEVSDEVRGILSRHKPHDELPYKSDTDLIWDLSQWMRDENVSNQDEYIGFLIGKGMPEPIAHQLLAIMGVEVKAPGSENLSQKLLGLIDKKKQSSI